MNATHQKLPDGTIELTITIPLATVAQNYNDVVEAYVTQAELPGFRKGKAPRNLVEEKIDKSKAYEDVIKKLLPTIYNEAVMEQKLHPIVSPKIEFKKAEEGKDWVIKIYTCEKPELTLGDYKTAIHALNVSKQKKIWVPGKDPKPEDDAPQKPTIDELLQVLLKTITVTLPALLLENEVNRLLSELIDQTKKLGLSVEQYLASTQRNAETIKKEYGTQAKNTLTLEFALEAIADKEGILVGDDDIDTVIKTAKTEEEKKALSAQRYYLASILRRQKTLDTLAAL